MTNQRTLAVSLCAVAVVVLAAQMLFAIGAQAAPYTNGDVLVSIGQGTGTSVNEYKPDGTLVQTLTSSGGPAGSTFDANGNFFVTAFNVNKVDKFDSNGTSAGTFGSGYAANPESILFDKAGNAYVGQAGPVSVGGSRPVLKFDSAGNLLATYTPAVQNRGTDWIELDADQCTLYYTSEGKSIKRFNVCTNTQLTDFATGLPGTYAFELRQMPNGDVLVANTDRVVRLNSSGAVTQTYTRTGAQELFALNLDPDGTSFWTADVLNGTVTRFNIAPPGNVISSFVANPGGVSGLTVRGEITVGGSAISLSPPSAINSVGTNHMLTATVTKGGSTLAGKTVTFSVDTGPNAGKTGSGVSDSNGHATFTYTDTGGAGVDSISASFTDDVGKLNKATATKTWVNPTYSAVRTQQYTLVDSDGATWTDIDATNLKLTVIPGANSTVILWGNADLWTANAGYNQDLALSVGVDAGADQVIAWKESGGFAGTFSPNAAFVQATYAISTGHSYVFKLKWKTNRSATGATIVAGAGGPAPFSPTSLIADLIPTGANPYSKVSTQQYSLADSDGATWQDLDATNLKLTVSPVAGAIAILGGNADLWTANAGYNQDLAISVGVDGGADQVIAWKESGGFAGTFSPNAAFVQTTYAVSSGHTYIFKLKWKTNRSATGATIVAGAGGPAPFSPTSLIADLIAATANPCCACSAVSAQQYSLADSDGVTWTDIDGINLTRTVSPGANSTAILGGNADLWTANAGYNQDLAISVSVDGGPDQVIAWKESGGFAGTFSPNAAFLQATYAISTGHTYVFKLKWKTNRSATGATIVAGAGGPAPFSPTSLVVNGAG